MHVGTTYFSLPGWQCPIFQATGIPCPGCGLSRAIIILLSGDWQRALQLHIFAPVVLLVTLVSFIVTFLPEGRRQWTIKKIEQIEMKTGVSFVILVSIVLYWVIRLIVSPAHFIELINSN